MLSWSLSCLTGRSADRPVKVGLFTKNSQSILLFRVTGEMWVSSLIRSIAVGDLWGFFTMARKRGLGGLEAKVCSSRVNKRDGVD